MGIYEYFCSYFPGKAMKKRKTRTETQKPVVDSSAVQQKASGG